jgi:methionyl-tRNA synthetase
METFYVTTPIYYANSAPHLGSLYTTVVADALRRYKRQRGLDTYFLTGTDEHGINIERLAAKRGISPQAHVDGIVREFTELFASFGLDREHGGYDIFMRTTAPFHRLGVEELWRRVRASRTPQGNEPLYKGRYEGWFCANCAGYKAEGEYLPPAGPNEAPKCADHLAPLERVAEESYFFRLSDYGESLLDLYERQPDFIRPEARRNEVISFVRQGLQDLSVSRLKTSVSWGLPVPDDAEHIIYVWFDALTNYITALGFGDERRSAAPGFEKYWPAWHLVGKDILRFHAVYWPAFLLAAGLPVPRGIYAHGMLLDGQGRKMGKALGNIVRLDLLKRFFSNDMVRYFILREVVFGQDGRVSYGAMAERSNSDLASGLGNLVSRTLNMLQKYCGGRVPADAIPEHLYLQAKRAGIDPDAQGLASAWELCRDQFCAHFDELAFSKALEAVWGVLARVDKLISDAKPWLLAKDEAARPLLEAALYRATESLRWAATLLLPVMPETARQMASLLALEGALDYCDTAKLTWGGLTPGTRIESPRALFPRIEVEKLMAEIETEAVGQAAAEEKAKDTSGYITLDDFAKVELRAGTILSAEKLPKADKLLALKVDLGEGAPRQILAGLAQFYEPDALIGKKVVIVANLAPRMMRGYESQGMVVAASFGAAGQPALATFSEEVPNGARLK